MFCPVRVILKNKEDLGREYNRVSLRKGKFIPSIVTSMSTGLVSLLGTLHDEGLGNGLREGAGEMQGPDREALRCQAKTVQLDTAGHGGHSAEWKRLAEWRREST